MEEFSYTHNFVASGSDVKFFTDIFVKVFREKNMFSYDKPMIYKYGNFTNIDFIFVLLREQVLHINVFKNETIIRSNGPRPLEFYKYLIIECLDEIFRIYDDYIKTRTQKRHALIHVMQNGLGNFQVGSQDYLSMHVAELAGLRDNRPGSRLAGGRKKKVIKKTQETKRL
jgi:hypothetical protein